MLRLKDSELQEMIRHVAREALAGMCSVDRLNAMERGEPVSAELWTQISALGWPGVLVPEEYGGTESGFDETAALCEELGRALIPGPFLSSAVISALLIAKLGTSAQKTRLLPAIASGQHVATPAITEEGYGWEAKHVTLRAHLDARAVRLDGAKHFVFDADVADTFICAARTGPKPANISLVLVDAKAAGVRIQRMPGWHSQPLFEVAFDGVKASRDQLLGELDAGWNALTPVLDRAAILLSAYVSGAMERVYEMTLAYAEERKQFGQSIARFQRVQDRLVDMRNWTDASALATKEAIGFVVDGSRDIARSASLAKLLSSRGFFYHCDAAHHVHAGIGSDKRYGLHLFSKASRTYYHYLGGPDFHAQRLADILEF